MNIFQALILKLSIPLMIMLIVSSANSVLAERFQIESSLGIGSEYSDNISFTRVGTKEDFLAFIRPSLSINYDTDQTSFNTDLMLYIQKYASESDEDRENQQYRFGVSHKLTDRLEFGGYAGYFKETDQEDTGEILRRQDNHRYMGKSFFSWYLSELSKVNVNYEYLKKDYERSDSDRHTISLSYVRFLNSGLDVIRLSPKYTYRDSDISELDDYNLSIGWLHRFSERLYIDTFIGGRYSEERYYMGDLDNDNTGFIAGLDVNWKTETGGMGFGYNRDLFTNAFGREREVDRFRYTYNRRLLPRIWGAPYRESIFKEGAGW